MPKSKRRIRDEFWFVAIVLGIVAFALLADWWEEHAVIGWTVVGILLAVLMFLAYRFASLRGWLGRQVKSAAKKAVFEEEASAREPLPQDKREEVLRRAHYRCENERCSYRGKPHIHHIDMNNSNNHLSNLIALCPNCHQKAHKGSFTATQLGNWVRRDLQRRRSRRTEI